MIKRLTWEDRIDNYVRAGFPRTIAISPEGYVFGLWTMGNDYRVKSGYHGGYPPTYLRRVRALFPDKMNALHLFAGMVDQSQWPGDTVDLNPDLYPTYLDDAQRLEKVPLQNYDIILADPPYTMEDADHYGSTMVKRNQVMKALARVKPGTHVVWLDQALPMYRKEIWAVDADIGMRKSTNHRFRGVTIFRRLSKAEASQPERPIVMEVE